MRAVLKVLEVFYHQMNRRIAGVTARRIEYRKWEYPPVYYVLEFVGLWPIKEYIQRLQAIIALKMIY